MIAITDDTILVGYPVQVTPIYKTAHGLSCAGHGAAIPYLSLEAEGETPEEASYALMEKLTLIVLRRSRT